MHFEDQLEPCDPNRCGIRSRSGINSHHLQTVTAGDTKFLIPQCLKKQGVTVKYEPIYQRCQISEFILNSEFFSLPISAVLFIFSPFWVNLPTFTHFFRIFEWHSLAPLYLYIIPTLYSDITYFSLSGVVSQQVFQESNLPLATS